MKNSESEAVRELRSVQDDVGWCWREAFAYPLHQEWKGDPIRPAFNEEGVFVDDNWNDPRINLFRSFFQDALRNNLTFIGFLAIVHTWNDDQNYVFINNLKTNALYYASWYKSRGRTDILLCNGHKINLGEFQLLLSEMLKPPHLSSF